MSNLTSLKMRAADRKNYAPSSLTGGEADGPQYPYGLELMLDDDTLAKLEVDELPTVGTVMTLIARVEVRSISSNEGPDKQRRQSMSLQITDACLEDGAPPTDLADALYKD